MDPDQTAQSGSMLVANLLCWFCREATHITTTITAMILCTRLTLI
jgi:hypothetical protein